MTDQSRTEAFLLPPSDNETDREARHQLLATLLGAYADGELPLETASQIDAHLLGCARCRREHEVHRAIRLRLEREPIPASSVALRDAIVAAVAQTPVAAVVPANQRSRRWFAGSPNRGWAFPILAVLLAVLSATVAAMVLLRTRSDATAARYAVSSVAAVPLFEVVLADYRRVVATELPGRARDLAAVRQALPFPVEALGTPGLRLMAAWTTDLNGERAAVLAYRWNDELVLQYIVSEQLLFRPPELRRAFADGRLLAAQDGAQSMLAWPAPTSGTLIVADMELTDLALVRVGARTR